MTLSAKTKKWLHAAIVAFGTGAASFIAYTLPGFLHLPATVKGATIGVLVAGISKLAGWWLGTRVGTDVPPDPPAAP